MTAPPTAMAAAANTAFTTNGQWQLQRQATGTNTTGAGSTQMEPAAWQRSGRASASGGSCQQPASTTTAGAGTSTSGSSAAGTRRCRQRLGHQHRGRWCSGRCWRWRCNRHQYGQQRRGRHQRQQRCSGCGSWQHNDNTTSSGARWPGAARISRRSGGNRQLAAAGGNGGARRPSAEHHR